ncbi:hypothetical protein BMF94_2180 [Rhodotorula taiwanensis]|uniref:RNA methyltransferase n=1 Tax=Rhodotorula taiwanensis TaxID=741276 RepID=A0A2S5BD46_9BASI|nr:hypothetical protein BMF94_2180 [Rhodotorula taiwanensis]
MSFEPAPHAKRQRTTFLDAGKPDLNPAAPVQPDIFSNRRPTHPTPAQSSTSRPRDGQGKKRERSTANGNYLGYYRRRREVQEGENDERLELIPIDWIKGKRVLDVGANAGEVAIELAQRFKASEVIGVDIDPELTHQARKNVDLAWSRQVPLPQLVAEARKLRRHHGEQNGDEDEGDPRSGFKAEEQQSEEIDCDYFPTSMARMFGFLPHPRGLVREYVEQDATSPRRAGRQNQHAVVEIRHFPENIAFETADWVNTPIPADREGYDVIFALSVTKWIHLQGLNPGLLVFFRRCFDSLRSGGRLILEPQPFSSYARNVKAQPELQERYDKLLSGAEKGWRAEDGDFERVLIELVGFGKRELLGETGRVATTFRRPVEVYTKR